MMLAAAAFALIWFFPGDGGTLSELHRLLHGDVDLTFGSSRLLIWRSLLPLIAERPLLGGGYGMLSLIQTNVVVKHHWLSSAEFTNIVAISQMTPGPIGINSATYCGYTAVHNAGYGYLTSMLGSLTATFALVLPSLILMILISKMLMKYMKSDTVQNIFLGLRPAVVGLLAAAALLLFDKENFSTSADTFPGFALRKGITISRNGTRKSCRATLPPRKICIRPALR